VAGNGTGKESVVAKMDPPPPPAKPKSKAPPKRKAKAADEPSPSREAARDDEPKEKPSKPAVTSKQDTDAKPSEQTKKAEPASAPEPKPPPPKKAEATKRPDIIMSRTQQGNRETRVMTMFSDQELVMLVRRCANEMPMLVRIHNSGNEQSLDRRHMKPHEALAFAIDDVLDSAKLLGQFSAAVLPDPVKLRSTATHPVYIAVRQAGLPPTLLIRNERTFTACTLIAATPQTTIELKECLDHLLPRADAGSLGSELDKAATIGAPLDIDELKRRVASLLSDPLIKPPKIDVHNAAPAEIPDKMLDLDGPIRFVVMLRARLADGTSRRVQITTDDYETACRIRFLIAKL